MFFNIFYIPLFSATIQDLSNPKRYGIQDISNPKRFELDELLLKTEEKLNSCSAFPQNYKPKTDLLEVLRNLIDLCDVLNADKNLTTLKTIINRLNCTVNKKHDINYLVRKIESVGSNINKEINFTDLFMLQPPLNTDISTLAEILEDSKTKLFDVGCIECEQSIEKENDNLILECGHYVHMEVCTDKINPLFLRMSKRILKCSECEIITENKTGIRKNNKTSISIDFEPLDKIKGWKKSILKHDNVIYYFKEANKNLIENILLTEKSNTIKKIINEFKNPTEQMIRKAVGGSKKDRIEVIENNNKEELIDINLLSIH